MADAKLEEDLVDYDDAAVEEPAAKADAKDGKKASFAAIHTSGFRDFLLKPELLQAIADCGFEHPSEVQQECIPQAILGLDVICQAKSGMGKTAVFVIAVLHQLEPQDGVIDSLVMCHTRELAYQICQEFERFSKYMQGVKVAVVYGGIGIEQNITLLKEEKPHVVVGTPGRVHQLLIQSKDDEKKGKGGYFKLDNLKRFVLDECDKMLETIDMRRHVQNIFKATPHEKQVMMFSATMSKEARTVARKFAQQPMEIFVDDESKLTLHGLRQHYAKLQEKDKNRKLNDILDALDFNQVVIFVNTVPRAIELNKILLQNQFPSMCIHGRLKQEERIERYNNFKNYKSRILVSTDIFGRGVDIERVNIVINYDMPQSTKKGEVADETAVQTNCDTYLHRVGRAGRFGTKGLAISFISSPEDNKVLEAVQARFEVEITPLPDSIESSTYMTS